MKPRSRSTGGRGKDSLRVRRSSSSTSTSGTTGSMNNNDKGQSAKLLAKIIGTKVKSKNKGKARSGTIPNLKTCSFKNSKLTLELRRREDKKICDTTVKVEVEAKTRSESEMMCGLRNLKEGPGSNKIFRFICDIYKQHKDKRRAEAMSKYMKNKFPFYGIQSPVRRSLNQQVWPYVMSLDSPNLQSLALETWGAKERELHYFTVDLLEREILRLYSGEEDFSSQSSTAGKTLSFVGNLIGHSQSWWDTVDPLSTNVVGPLVQKYPTELLPIMDKWNAGSNIWLCRTSLLYQLKYKKNTDEQRLFRYCETAAENHKDEFFVQKAIGWALRQHYRINPNGVKALVNANKSNWTKLIVREALKHDKQ